MTWMKNYLFLCSMNLLERLDLILKLEYSVDSKKLAELMETAHNFENVDAGLAKMDGYLN